MEMKFKMTVLMIANISKSKFEGISKKIFAQARSFSILEDVCDLICYDENGIYKVHFVQGNLDSELKIDVFDSMINTNSWKMEILNKICVNAMKIEKNNDYNIIYIRHMIPTFNLIKFLSKNKSRHKIYYEIPTYPYFFEQFYNAKNKFKTSLRLVVELLFWPFIYLNVHRLIIIQSNSKVHLFKKMIKSYNGYDKNNVPDWKSFPEIKDLNFIGVGTIYSYHGYDKLILAIKEFTTVSHNFNIFFHIVGDSEEIENLKKLVTKLNLQSNIIFYGKQFGEDLDEIFSNSNIGVGCLALEKRNADIDTTIKNVEYIARRIPFISNGYFYDLDLNNQDYLKISNKNIDLFEIYEFMQNYYNNKVYHHSEEIVNFFEWKKINEKLLKN